MEFLMAAPAIKKPAAESFLCPTCRIVHSAAGVCGNCMVSIEVESEEALPFALGELAEEQAAKMFPIGFANYIAEVPAGSKAEGAVQIGFTIATVNDKSTKGMTLAAIESLIKEEKSNGVKLGCIALTEIGVKEGQTVESVMTHLTRMYAAVQKKEEEAANPEAQAPTSSRTVATNAISKYRERQELRLSIAGEGGNEADKEAPPTRRKANRDRSETNVMKRWQNEMQKLSELPVDEVKAMNLNFKDFLREETENKSRKSVTELGLSVAL